MYVTTLAVLFLIKLTKKTLYYTPFGPYRTTAQLVGTLDNVTDITLCDIIVDKHK